MAGSVGGGTIVAGRTTAGGISTQIVGSIPNSAVQNAVQPAKIAAAPAPGALSVPTIAATIAALGAPSNGGFNAWTPATVDSAK